MREPEIASRYRNRFVAAETQVHRLETIIDEGQSNLDDSHPWLYVSIVPNSPREAEVSLGTTKETTDWLRQEVWTRPSGGERLFTDANEVGVRRVISAPVRDQGGLVRGVYAEFHADGSSFAAAQLGQRDTNEIGDPVNCWVLLETALVELVVYLTAMISQHAIRRGCLGDGVAELGIVAGASGPTLRNPMVLTNDRFHGVMQNTTERLLARVPPSRHTIDLVATSSDAGSLLVSARLLITNMVQAFGLAEVLHIDREGRLRVNYFGANRERARHWAQQHLAEVSEATTADD